ncbi:hypothetical protein CEXT_532991 [Caerostris extrusa]|uniref:Uncharacterized protein n=1 Tax=Caerostris extrusa TaxID=172846 RepID=A0AAV4PRB6_CAEEX|nr:hypothetical protein CEXT_532991 [Caerostris extrusa]
MNVYLEKTPFSRNFLIICIRRNICALNIKQTYCKHRTAISDPKYIANPLSLLLFCRKEKISQLKKQIQRESERKTKIGEQRCFLCENSERGIVMDARTIDGISKEGKLREE